MITNSPPENKRCVECRGEIVQRADDTEGTVRKRLQVYEEKTSPLKAYFQQQGRLKIFQADGTVAQIQNDIRSFLDAEVK